MRGIHGSDVARVIPLAVPSNVDNVPYLGPPSRSSPQACPSGCLALAAHGATIGVTAR
jgi:hypothetical protein